MAEQYWIGGFFIDLSRNQITQNNQSQTIPPKALAVLTYLAKNQGKVVGQDELLTKVWQDTAVSPNTLQKNIAQLRKALGDDGRGQVYIQTHAKKGYSLECDVRWQEKTNSKDLKPENAIETIDDNQTNSDSHTVNKSDTSRSNLKLIPIFVTIIILTIIGYLYLGPKQISQLSIDKIRPLTATDDKEFGAIYTPDGQYIVFNRYLDGCTSHLWAKNIATQKEFQLTKDWGAYDSHSFSKDGKKLVFIEMEACGQIEPVVKNNCYNLINLDFAKALQNPQQTTILLRCKSSIITKPKWLNNNNIALIQYQSNQSKLINYSISENKSFELYDQKQGNLLDFSYSSKHDLIAVISIHTDGQHYIEMLKPDGQILSSHPVERPEELPKYRNFYPSFAPFDDQLFFSTGKQLFKLSYQGKITKINLPFGDNMVDPEFHPDGKKLLMIKRLYDSDIVQLPINPISLSSSSTKSEIEKLQTYSTLDRSNLGENQAVFQPNGKLIAFWSDRSGDEQIWINDGNLLKQLTQFPTDTYIDGFNWAADGKSLLVNANKTLTQVFLNSEQKSFALEFPIQQLLQWDSKNHSALLFARINGISKLIELNLDNLKYQEAYDNKRLIFWALKNENGQLIYKDIQGQFWKMGPIEPQLIEAIDMHGLGSKRFLLKDNVIYDINNKKQLWSYNLETKTFKILGTLAENVNNLTDINETEILMTTLISAKKEVVELTLSE